MQQFFLSTEIAIQNLTSDLFFQFQKFVISYKACMIFCEQHEISLTACKLYDSFTFEQKLEFSDVELTYKLQVKQFH